MANKPVRVIAYVYNRI